MADRKQYEITTTYTIKYTTKNPVPISEIIRSLLAVERLLKRTAPLIEKKYEDLEVYDVQVFVESLQSGSLSENYFVRILCGGKENAEHVEATVEKLMKNGSPIGLLIAAGVGVMVGTGISSILSDSPNTTDFTNNTIINIGAEMDISAGDVRAFLEAIPDKKKMARDAVDFIRPAKSDPDATIENEGFAAADIPQEVISEAPEHYEPPTPAEREVMYQNVPIFAFASDKDKHDTGWAGTAEGVAENRTRIVLDESINPEQLHGRPHFNADITVIQRYNTSKKAYENWRIVIRSVN